MKTISKALYVVLAVLLALALPAAALASASVPKENCWGSRTDAVSQSTLSDLNAIDLNLKKNCSGARICVVLESSIGGDSIENYASEIINKWQIGSEEAKNGVLVLMVLDDKDYLIVPGEGLKDVFTATALTDISLNYCEPFFRTGDYDKAVAETCRTLNKRICAHYGVDPSASFEPEVSDEPQNLGNLDIFELFNLGLSCTSCSSCGSVKGIIITLIIIYIVLQVFKGSRRRNKH